MDKAVEEKVEEEEGIKQQDNINSKSNNQEHEQCLSLSSRAYKRFSERETPLEVAIALNLRESEAAKFYRVLEAKTTTQSEYGLWRA